MSAEHKDEGFKVTDRRVGTAAGDGTKDQPAGGGHVDPETVQQEYEKAVCQEKERCHLPMVDMGTFILSLSSSVLVHLGEVPEPISGKMEENLDLAKHTIDILIMLEEKTRGNLTLEEERLMRDVLFELRMKYVQKVG